MRKLAPKLILQGDTRKARAWIPWAQKALDRLKNIGKITDRVMRPIAGVAVHVKSVAGIDTIRIAVDLGGKCEVQLAATQTGPLTVEFTAKFLKKGTVAETEAREYFFDFGDEITTLKSSLTPGAVTVSHEYLSAGNYSVSVKSWSRKKDVTSEILDGKLVLGSIQSSVVESKDLSSPINPYSAAWSAFLALPWGVVADADVSDFIVSGHDNFAILEFGIQGFRTTFTTDLTGKGSVFGIAIHSAAGTQKPPTTSTIASVWHNGVLQKTMPPAAVWPTYGVTYLHDIGVVDKDSISEVLFTDSSGHLVQPFPAPIDSTINENLGWATSQGNLFVDYYPYHCKAEKTVSVAVT